MVEPVEGTVLGKQVTHKQTYDPDVLVRVPRIENRTIYNIDEDNLPFIGYDTWDCYEISSTTTNGRPFCLVGKIVYPSNSKYIVESKSLKLYLNSFNMTKLKPTFEESVDYLRHIIRKDLSNYLECPVEVSLFTDFEFRNKSASTFTEYRDIEDCINIDNIKFVDYNENPDLLKLGNSACYWNKFKISCNLLRSNCKITKAPDWGTAYISVETNNSVGFDLEDIVKYLVSFRNENHFHEEVTEMIYKRFYDKLIEQSVGFKLGVSSIYLRRGGIGICPQRVSHYDLLDKDLLTSSISCYKKFRQ